MRPEQSTARASFGAHVDVFRTSKLYGAIYFEALMEDPYRHQWRGIMNIRGSYTIIIHVHLEVSLAGLKPHELCRVVLVQLEIILMGSPVGSSGTSRIVQIAVVAEFIRPEVQFLQLFSFSWPSLGVYISIYPGARPTTTSYLLHLPRLPWPQPAGCTTGSHCGAGSQTSKLR